MIFSEGKVASKKTTQPITKGYFACVCVPKNLVHNVLILMFFLLKRTRKLSVSCREIAWKVWTYLSKDSVILSVTSRHLYNREPPFALSLTVRQRYQDCLMFLKASCFSSVHSTAYFELWGMRWLAVLTAVKDMTESVAWPLKLTGVFKRLCDLWKEKITSSS